MSRKKQNIFWLTKTPYKHATDYVLYNRLPYKTKLWYHPTLEHYDNECWFSGHGELPLASRSNEKFKEIDHTKAVPVRLVPTKSESEKADVYLQRYKDCLFISTRLNRYIYMGQDFREVPHVHMISNKLFPEITEETGIVRMDIEII